jgi:GT2 family glycosyltransferase
MTTQRAPDAYQPKVGVVIPARNALHTVETMLITCWDQTYPVSVYIADDASDDGMSEFLTHKGRRDWYRGYTRHEQQQGWPGATNTAAQMALDDGCDVLQIGAADDFMRLDMIERSVRALANRDWVIAYSQQVGRGPGQVDSDAVQTSAENLELADFAVWCRLTDKGMFKRHVWETVGGYSSDVTVPSRPWGSAEDVEFWIKVFKAGFTNYEVIKIPLYYYVMRPGQLGEGRINVHDETVAVLRAKHPDVWEAWEKREEQRRLEALVAKEESR